MKKVPNQLGEIDSLIQTENESRQLNSNTFTNIYNDNNEEEKKNIQIIIKYFFHFISQKIFIIRFMLFFVSFLFCYLVIKLKDKESKEFKNQDIIIEQKVYNLHNLATLHTKQLINAKNLKFSKNLNINLNLEHSKYVHLQIDNFYYNSWRVPKEILNKEYFDTLDEINLKPKSNFLIEYQKTEHSFSFNIYQESISSEDKIEKNIFYSFTTKQNFLFSKNYINFESILTSDNIFGFGERIHKFKLKEGIYTIWPTNQKSAYDYGKGGQNLFGHQPIGLHKTKFKDLWLGFVFLNSNAQDIQIYKKMNDETVLAHKTIGGILNYYIIVDNSPENVIKDINFLLGPPTLPPYWALGFHQGENEYKNLSEFKQIYKTYIIKKIPLDAMWMNDDLIKNDEDYSFKNFGNFIKNKLQYKYHTNFITTINFGIPYQNSEYHDYKKIGKDYNLFIKSGFTQKNLISEYETGKTMIPDFLDPEIDKLWNKLLLDIYNREVRYDGINLEIEPNILNNKEICQGEKISKKDSCNVINQFHLSYLPGYNDHINILSKGGINLNAYTYNNIIFNNKPLINIYQSKHSYNFMNAIKKRPFIISKGNSFGSGKYSFHYFAENYNQNFYLESTISSIFSYNIFGMPFTGSEICGPHKKEKSDNDYLCARWYNIGSFYPLMKNANSNYKTENIEDQYQYPWSYGPKIENIIRKNIQMRYSLIKYFYSQLFLVSINEKGSFFKPIMFEFPNDDFSYENIEDKIMLGEAFLLCGFYDNEEKNKEFVFPNENFNKYPSGDNVVNYNQNDLLRHKKHLLSGKINELHIFLRGGYIVPMQDTFDKYIWNTFYLRQEKLNLIINPNHEGYSKGTIFFDNDEYDTLQNNKYIRVDMEFKNKILKINVAFSDIDYIYSDDILYRIEIWRINEIIKEEIINKGKMDITIKVKEQFKKIVAIFDKYDNKMKIYFLSKISLFDLREINLNSPDY